MEVIFWSEKIVAKNTLVPVRGGRPGNIYLFICTQYNYLRAEKLENVYTSWKDTFCEG